MHVYSHDVPMSSYPPLTCIVWIAFEQFGGASAVGRGLAGDMPPKFEPRSADSKGRRNANKARHENDLKKQEGLAREVLGSSAHLDT